jgi:anti-sigma factor RsiW
VGCTTVSEDLLPFHFGTLDAAAREHVESHLCECGECLRLYLQLKRATESAPAMFAPRLSASARGRLHADVAATFASSAPRTSRLRGRVISIGAIAAVFALGLFSSRFFTTPMPPESAERVLSVPAPSHEGSGRVQLVGTQVDSAETVTAQLQFL